MKKKRSTINDVANLAGVSISTVSGVINNSEKYISSELRLKVEQAISELNYRPNLIARSLKLQQTKTIGLIVTNITSPVIPPLVRTVQMIAQQNGFDTFIVSSEENAKIQDDAIRSMLSKQVDGLIICPTQSNNTELIQNAIKLIPVVSVERELSGTSSVLTNNKETSYRIANHMIDHGYKRIGMITMQVFGSNTNNRIEGFKEAMHEHGRFDPGLIQETDYVGLSAQKVAMDLIKTKKVDAIMTASQSITLGTYTAIIGMGLKIPDDIAIFGYDDLPWMEAVRPKISTTRQPIEEMSSKACEILFSALDGESTPNQTYCIDTHLIIRNSCGCGNSY